MGAQQALQWAVSHPAFMDRIVATCGTAKTYGHGIVRLDGQIAALTLDPAFDDGHYTAQPARGIRATALVWLGWLYSQEWWRQELWRVGNPPGTTFRQAVDQATDQFFDGDDANDLILQMRSWQRHDVGHTPPFAGDLEAALARSKRRCCTCRPRPTSTSPRTRPGMNPATSAAAASCRSRRSGATPPAPAPAPPTPGSSTTTSPPSWRVAPPHRRSDRRRPDLTAG